MTKEQFFKAIDGVDDKLLKEALDFKSEYNDAQHATVYRLERSRSHLWQIFAAAAASLAIVFTLGFLFKYFSDNPQNEPPAYSGNHTENSSNDPDNSQSDDSSDVQSTPNSDDSQNDPPVYSDNHTENSPDDPDNSQSDDSSDTQSTTNESIDSLPHIVETKPLSENYMMDVCFSEEDIGSAAVSMRPVGISENQTVTAYLQTRIAQYSDDYSALSNEDVTLRVFVFADGNPIDFALEGSDDYDKFHDITVKTHNGGDTVSVTAITFKADPSMNTISFIGSFERIEWFDQTKKDEFSIYSGIISATAYNYEAAGSQPENGNLGMYIETDTPAQSYLQMSTSSEYYDEGMGAGYKGQFLQDSSLYIKFKVGVDRPYYLVVLQNDEPAAVFDSQYSVAVTCHENLYMYEIKQSDLEILDKNIIQAVAVPAAPSTDADYKFLATQKEGYYKGFAEDAYD